jgi:hypothetical protein
MTQPGQNVSGKISDAGFERLEAVSCDRREESVSSTSPISKVLPSLEEPGTKEQ